MNTRRRTRFFRRFCRPVPSAVSHIQVRQKADRLRDLYELESALELSRVKPDINYLLQLDLESTYVRDVLASIEGRI
jgi:hypothetical protein